MKKLREYLQYANELKKNSCGKPLRVAILRSFSCETVESILVSELFDLGIFCEVIFGGYNQFYQEVLEESFLRNLNPDVLIFAIRVEDFWPSFYHDFSIHAGVEPVGFAEVLDFISGLLEAATAKLSIPILIHNFAKPNFVPFAMYQTQNGFGLGSVLRRLNLELTAVCERYPTVYLVDFEAVVSEVGFENTWDLRMWEVAKNPYTVAVYVNLGKLYSRMIFCLKQTRKKCIVLDLDNTLWRGVIGESENQEIVMYSDFQRYLLQLYETGILLAVCSKNNEADALGFMESRKDMILKREHFSCLKINWEDKAGNIQMIAQELNILPDSLVFVDDSPVECELVRQYLPDVTVVNLPKQEYLFLDEMQKVVGLDFLQLTQEDLLRNRMYREQNQRKEFLAEKRDLSGFLKGLGMKARIEKVGADDLSRVVQLIQKTNQFNLTGKRYTEPELAELLRSGGVVYRLRLWDRFGDNGICGAMVVIPDHGDWVMDTFVLSCRVMSRDVERAFVGFLVDEARACGVLRLVGVFVRTEKNKPVAGLYEKLGFCAQEDRWLWFCDRVFEKPDCIEILSE